MTASSSQKPVVVLVHGAWHHPVHYRALIFALQEQGYTVLAPLNATVGYDDAVVGKTYKDDVKRVHDYLFPVLDEGREVIMLCHSYGGVPGTASIEGNTVAERTAKGLKGGVKSVLYISALLPPVRDTSVWDLLGQAWPEWHRAQVRTPDTPCPSLLYRTGINHIMSTGPIPRCQSIGGRDILQRYPVRH
jgi:pimeloyl-ACP methyl ester carboxylesterase